MLISLISLHLLHNLVTSLLHLGYNFYTRNAVLVVQEINPLKSLYSYVLVLITCGTLNTHFYYLKYLNNLNNPKHLNNPYPSSLVALDRGLLYLLTANRT